MDCIEFINGLSAVEESDMSLRRGVELRCLGIYQCLGRIKNKGIYQGDIKLNSAKILEQTLIREIFSYSFSSIYWMLPLMLSI
jgi:hypothetical protein